MGLALVGMAAIVGLAAATVGCAGAELGAIGVLVAIGVVAAAATGMIVSAQGASIVVVHPHSVAEYVTVVLDMGVVGRASTPQVVVLWQAHSSS